MKTGCKSCQNWTQKNGEEGWCANFKKIVFHNPSCGEWRLRVKDGAYLDAFLPLKSADIK